ncbi:peptidoglycan-binding domain-containing protein [Pseudanabaena sp. UWO310]|uniref:peptidoglycan-binding domain-containing protein n=1 Tax=Pseudanabaena sp. UWO310 TaxID=2480795 RepID=UPI0011590C02|nr:peptidoglycan-binding domain-containing protein [Pseudanabaena sp. UWO310]TYQ30281.1 peptidoglycan-binding protein [Pseudanabaena sp. UWO310]
MAGTEVKLSFEELTKAQTYLQQLGLYDGEIDGIYGKLSEAAFVQFANALSIDTILDANSQAITNNLLQMPAVVRYLLEIMGNGDRLWQKFINSQNICVNMGQVDSNLLGFLDRGVNGCVAGSKRSLPNRSFAPSPLLKDIALYPDRLASLPDGVNVVSYGEVAMLAKSQVRVRFRPYPALDQVPNIENIGLEFLHSSIQQACICIGSIVNGQMLTRWIGLNPLANVQFWSSTKILPLLYTLCAANQAQPNQAIANCAIADVQGKITPRTYAELAQRICNYDESNGITSNALAAMFKQFTNPITLQNWLIQITGNKKLSFQGRYGEVPYIDQPTLRDTSGQVVLSGVKDPHRGDNLISAYDLTRIVSQIAWHRHIPPTNRLPAAQWHSLSTLINAMGQDTARYVDAAIAALGLTYFIGEPVVFSKMGFGYSDQRRQTELTYTASIQFVDRLAQSHDLPLPKLRSVNMTLRAVLNLQDPVRESLEIDARMATTVAEILRRIVTEELI